MISALSLVLFGAVAVLYARREVLSAIEARRTARDAREILSTLDAWRADTDRRR